MTNLNGTNLAAGIVTFTTEDTYPTHFDSLGKGGYRSVNTVVERDLIPAARRTAGMLVYVKEDNTEYRLKGDNTWEVKPAGVESDPIYNADKPNIALKSDIPDISNLAEKASLATKADLVDGLVPSSQLPSYVDDVLSFSTLIAFPVTGEDGKIYIAKDTNITYRWSGSSYAPIGSDLALGETSATAYRGDKGKIAYDHSQLVHDKAFVGLDKVDNTSDLDKAISTATQAALNNKVNIDGNKKLTDENYTLVEKNKLSTIESGAQVNPDLSTYAKTADINTALALKADKTEVGSSIQIVRL